jgi:hypothetical protein
LEKSLYHLSLNDYYGTPQILLSAFHFNKRLIMGFIFCVYIYNTRRYQRDFFYLLCLKYKFTIYFRLSVSCIQKISHSAISLPMSLFVWVLTGIMSFPSTTNYSGCVKGIYESRDMPIELHIIAIYNITINNSYSALFPESHHCYSNTYNPENLFGGFHSF